MAERVTVQRLVEAVGQSNCIEGEPMVGESFDRHLRAAEAAIGSVLQPGTLDPRTLHRIAYEGFYHHAGKYRNVDVYINSTNHGLILFPPPEQVPALMDSWLSRLNKMTPWEAHVEFESIHPFEDGNGRIGRCILWAMESTAGQEISVIRCAERFADYNRLQADRTSHQAGPP